MRKFDRRVIIPIIVFFLLVCLGAVGYLVFKNINIWQSDETYHQLQSTTASAAETTLYPEGEDPSNVAPRVENPVDFQKMLEIFNIIKNHLNVT